MVVGPRFNQPGWRGGVGAVGRGSQGLSGQRTEITYLRPPERSGHDVSLEVDIRAGMDIEETVCRSHEVDVEKQGPARATVKLSPRDSIPNKDFVLRYRLAGGRTRSALLAHRDERGG